MKQPFVPTENNMLILQESCIDPLGSLVIYAPIDMPAMNIATSGQDPSEIPIQPVGLCFIIHFHMLDPGNLSTKMYDNKIQVHC